MLGRKEDQNSNIAANSFTTAWAKGFLSIRKQNIEKKAVWSNKQQVTKPCKHSETVNCKLLYADLRITWDTVQLLQSLVSSISEQQNFDYEHKI